MADAFVALPGGVGTLEEVVEQMTWAQLGRHKKPILLANIKDFWDPLCALLDHMEELQFIRPGLTVNYLLAERVEDILPMLTEACADVSEAEKAMKPPVAGRCERASAPSRCERHRFDAVALGIAHEGRVIASPCIPGAGPARRRRCRRLASAAAWNACTASHARRAQADVRAAVGIDRLSWRGAR